MTTDNLFAPDAPAAQPPESRVQPAPVRRSFILTFLLAMLGIWIITLTPLIVSLPLKVRALNPDPATQGISLSIMLGVGAFVGVLANPVFGRLSDRTVSRLGMRRPWLIFAAGTSLVGFVVLGLADSLPVATLGWAAAQIGINAGTAVLLSLIPDQVPTERRGMVSGLVGFTQAVAGVLGVVLVGGLAQVSLALAIIAPAVVAAVFILVAVMTLQDRRLAVADRPPFSWGEFVRSFWVSPRRHPDFGWAWFSRFAIFMAISMVLNYQIFYLTVQLGVGDDDATSIVGAAIAIQSVLIVIVSVVFGPLSDRLRRRKVFVLISALVTAIGLTIIALAPARPSSVVLFLIGVAFVGAGQGVYFAVDLALVTDVLPNRDKDAGKDLGVLGLAQLIPQSLAPAIAPAFLVIPVLSATGIAGANYTVLYIGGVVFAVISALSVLKIKGVR